MAELKMDFAKMADCFTKTAKEKGMFVGWWIPVSERLPKPLMDVLLCNEEGEIGVGKYIDFNDMFYVAGWDIFWAVAWMPLPQPYKGESEVQDANCD